MAERLDAFLSRAGFGSRRDAKALIKAGRVMVNGINVKDPGASVSSGVSVDSKPVEPAPDGLWVILNKPIGIACSHDPTEAPLLDGLLPPIFRRLGAEPAGRLDRETSGLLVITSDGALIQRLTHPKRHVTKRYRVVFEGTLAEDAVDRFKNGILLEGEDEVTRPARIEVESGVGRSQHATIWLREGRYHQVRRMLAAVGGKVTALHRDRVGAFDLPSDLRPGEFRDLSEKEIELLLSDEAT